jgi:hypothetical protein
LAEWQALYKIEDEEREAATTADSRETRGLY